MPFEGKEKVGLSSLSFAILMSGRGVSKVFMMDFLNPNVTPFLLVMLVIFSWAKKVGIGIPISFCLPVFLVIIWDMVYSIYIYNVYVNIYRII